MPQSTLRDLQELRDPALAQTIREHYLNWLCTPDNQSRQTDAVLFDGEHDCCALGGLALVLQTAGFARVDRNGLRVTLINRGQILDHWANTLPWQLGMALGWRLGSISVLNDDRNLRFAQIAAALRGGEIDTGTLPY